MELGGGGESIVSENDAQRTEIVERHVNGIQSEEDGEKRGELGDPVVRC